MLRTAALLTTTILLASTTVAQQRLYTTSGATSDALLGSVVAPAGDVNGDERADFVIGIPGDRTNGPDAGAAVVISGIDGQTVLLSVFGDDAGDGFGSTVSAAGDVNADGYDDIVIGAPLDDDAGFDSGRVRVYSGADRSVLHTFDAPTPGIAFGYAVTRAGDVDNDGYDDIAVSAPQASVNGVFSGSVTVFSGRDGSTLHVWHGQNAGDFFGIAISSAGDVDDDRYADLLVGSIGDDTNGADAGSAIVFSGLDGSVIHTFFGDAAGDCLGCAVAEAGRVDADRNTDLIVGMRFATGDVVRSGAARVYSGVDGATLYTFPGPAPNTYFGTCVGGGGDLDGDGHDDLIVGEPFSSSVHLRGGVAHVYSGSDGMLMFTIPGDAPFDAFGSAVAILDDVDRDNFDELVVGAPLAESGGAAVNSGIAVVYQSGASGDPSYVRYRGFGCDSSNGNRPRAFVRDRPTLGATLAIEVRGATPARSAYVAIGTRQSLDLTTLGAPRCFLYLDIIVASQTVVDAAGLGSSPFLIPDVPAAVGVNLHAQWLMIDPGANLLGLSVSNDVIFTIGA